MVVVKKCPECSSANVNINKERGEVTCRSCGLVIEERMIDFGQEWREFESNQESRRRTGAPMTYTRYDRGLGTDIGQKGDIFQLKGKGMNKFFRTTITIFPTLTHMEFCTLFSNNTKP